MDEKKLVNILVNEKNKDETNMLQEKHDFWESEWQKSDTRGKDSINSQFNCLNQEIKETTDREKTTIKNRNV